MTKLKPFVFAACEDLGFGIVKELLTNDKLKSNVEWVGAGIVNESTKAKLEKLGAEVVQYKKGGLDSVKKCLKKADCAIVIVHEFDGGHELALKILECIQLADLNYVQLISLTNADKAPKESNLHKFYKLEAIYTKCKFEGVIIRCGIYTDLLIHSSNSIQKDNQLKLNLGAGKFSPITKSDLSYFVASALVKYRNEPVHESKYHVVNLTGNKLYTGMEIAICINKVLGSKKVEYKDLKKGEMKKVLEDQSLNEHYINYFIDLFEMAKEGCFKEITHDYKRVTGEDPKGIKNFIKQNEDSFKPK